MGGTNVVANTVLTGDGATGFTTFYLPDTHADYLKTVTVYPRTGNVDVTGRFSNVEMAAMIEAIIEWAGGDTR